MVYGVTEEVTKLGCSMIAEEWESYDELLRERKDLRKGWYIARKDETMITTSLGDVTYSRTLFKNTKTGVSCYLLDKLIEIEPHTRMTEDAVAHILEEAAESSYRKGGANASISGSAISKETVMNKLHVLKFPQTLHQGEKKVIETLYIDAGEDHVSLQYLEKKGDIKKPRNNTVMPRLAYVYEGVDTEVAKLRVYQKNGWNMLELVRYQKEELPLAAGAEEVIYSATEMITMGNRNKNRLGALADIPVYSIPYPQIKKIAALKNHIWGL